ncbi:hypothetical protein GOODEAATRI_020128 [Goodea atripinnis]|uniref:Uncharacterized protein n=1 Tax=Goodea atripinnis TaxID=208336 RepID=A0ABV0P6D1_9TELE
MGLLSVEELVTGKRSEGKEASDFQGGEYEAAVNQEKQDDRRSLQELPGRDGASGEADSGSEQEEVSVAALNVSLTAASVSSAGSSRTRSILLLYAQTKRFSHQGKALFPHCFSHLLGSIKTTIIISRFTNS